MSHVSPRTALADAARKIAALRDAIPAPYRPPFDESSWDELRQEVERLDDERALSLIADWAHNLSFELSGVLAATRYRGAGG